MVKIINELPRKHATMIRVPKGRPEVTQNETGLHISYGDWKIPDSKTNRFLSKCGINGVKSGEVSTDEIAQLIHEANEKKNLYLRFAGHKPLSVVTDAFREIRTEEISDRLSKLTGSTPKIRYFDRDERLQINFPLESKIGGMNLVLDTGKFGVYGGLGEQAARYGISWHNSMCSNWTLFLNDFVKDNTGRMIHIDKEEFYAPLENLVSAADSIGEKIEESKNNYFTGADLSAYLDLYSKKGIGQGIGMVIMAQKSNGISAYDLSFNLTKMCQAQYIADSTRAKIEYLAGEVILCFDDIIKTCRDPQLNGANMPLESAYN